MKPFDHSEEDLIKALLEESAGEIQPNSAFTENLEKQLKQAHTPKASLNMFTLKKDRSSHCLGACTDCPGLRVQLDRQSDRAEDRSWCQ